MCQVQVVPSGDLITPSLPFTDWTVPRSNESVWKPALLRKVTVPSTPPRWRSRPSAQRTRAGEVAGLLAALSSVFSWAPEAPDTPEAPDRPDTPEAPDTADAAEAGPPPPDTAARVIPPPARRPARAAPAPQRCHRLVRDLSEGSGAPAGYPPPAGASYMVFMPVSVGLGSWTSP